MTKDTEVILGTARTWLQDPLLWAVVIYENIGPDDAGKPTYT